MLPCFPSFSSLFSAMSFSLTYIDAPVQPLSPPPPLPHPSFPPISLSFSLAFDSSLSLLSHVRSLSLVIESCSELTSFSLFSNRISAPDVEPLAPSATANQTHFFPFFPPFSPPSFLDVFHSPVAVVAQGGECSAANCTSGQYFRANDSLCLPCPTGH